MFAFNVVGLDDRNRFLERSVPTLFKERSNSYHLLRREREDGDGRRGPNEDKIVVMSPSR